MKPYIECPKVTLDALAHERIGEVVGYGLMRFVGRVSGVELTLHDENGPRGGIDKRCVVRGNLHGRG